MGFTLEGLDESQYAAATAGEGPLLIIAGPGSGKTLVVTARVLHLVEEKAVEPESVLLMTFSTKARDEIIDRLHQLLGGAAPLIPAYTFHEFGYRIVRQYHHLLGYAHEPATYDEEAAGELFREVLVAAGRNPDRERVSDLQADVDRARLVVQGSWAPAWRVTEQAMARARAYEAALVERNGIDFTGQVAFALRVVQESPDALELYQTGYRYVLLDEFQDTTPTHYELIRLVAGAHRNLMAVGDDNQAVYRWAGANPEKVLGMFREHFPEHRQIELPYNYRCKQRAVDAANLLSRRLNPERQMVGMRDSGEEIRVVALPDERSEAEYVAEISRRLREQEVIRHYGDVLVLYRTRVQADPIIDVLEGRSIPYIVRGSGDLFRKPEVRLVHMYLRLAYDLNDSEALAYVVNRPPRKLKALADALKREPVGFDELPKVMGGLSQEEGVFPDASFGAGIAFMEVVEALARLAREVSAPKLIDAILELTGIAAWLEKDPAGERKLGNVRKLRSLAERAALRLSGTDTGDARERLGLWLSELALGGDHATLPDEREAMVLSTIHGAKGSQAKVVFVMGMEDGLLPIHTALELTPEKPVRMREELCLAYVGLTRATERLYLTRCEQRTRDGKTVGGIRPSRFIEYAGLGQARAA